MSSDNINNRCVQLRKIADLAVKRREVLEGVLFGQIAAYAIFKPPEGFAPWRIERIDLSDFSIKIVREVDNRRSAFDLLTTTHQNRH